MYMYVCNNAGNLRSEGKGDTTEDKDKEKYVHVYTYDNTVTFKGLLHVCVMSIISIYMCMATCSLTRCID